MTAFKKILSLVLVICMFATVLTFTACNKDKNEGTNDENNETNNGGNENVTTDKTYTVTVLDGDNNPVEGVKLILTDGNTYLPPVATDANGKASGQLPDASTVSVMVTSVPDGYVKPEKVSDIYHGVFASGSTEFTLKIEKEADNKIEYTVKVVDQNGDPVVGMKIQLCPNGVCLADKFETDANGEITAKLNPNVSVDVKLLEGLEGYTLPIPVKDSYHAVIESGETEVTVTVIKN